MTSTAELLISITANAGSANAVLNELMQQTRLLEAGFGATGAAVQQASAKTQDAHGLFSSLGDEFASIGKQATAMATGILAADLTMGIAERFKSAAEEIDVFGQAALKVQRITGETASASSTLVAMFERYSGSLTQGTTSLIKFEQVLAGQEAASDIASAGGKRAGQYLQEFGVNVNDATGHIRPMLSVLLDVADAFSKSSDTTQKEGALQALFKVRGDAASGLMLMLNQGRAGLQAFADDVQKYGLSLTGENLADVQAFTFAHKDMDMALQGVSLQLGAAFMPSITKAAEMTASFAQVINQTVVPGIERLGAQRIDWIVPAAASALLLGAAYQGVAFVTAPLFKTMGALGAAVTAQGASAAVAAAENTALAASEVEVGTAAVATTAKVGGMASAGAGLRGVFTAIGASGVVAFAGVGAVVALLGIQLKNQIDDLYKLRDAANSIPDAKMNDAQRATRDALDKLPVKAEPAGTWHAPMATAMQANAGWHAPMELPEVISAKEAADAAAGNTGPSGAVKAATAIKDTATAQAQELQDAAAARKVQFDATHMSAETNILNLKMAQTAAEADLLGYKDKIAALDLAAVNFAQQRLQLDEQSAVIKAQMAESPLKSADEDIRYQEDRIKAQLKAAHAGGPAVDTAAMHQQLRDLASQDARMQLGLLDAAHNVTLASRAKTTTDEQAGLGANATAQAKLGIDEAMAPATAAALLATQAVQDKQKLLDLAKQQFDIDESGYKLDLLKADLAKKTADHVLFTLAHPDIKPATAASDLGLPNDPRQRSALSLPSPASTPGLPDNPHQWTAPPNVNVSIGQVGHSSEDVWNLIKGQIMAAWDAAMAGHPVSGTLGGSYSTRGGGSG
jgi:hypothetical protein